MSCPKAAGRDYIMKKFTSILSLLLVCVLLCSCGAFQVKNVSVIATVNGEDILEEEFNYFLLVAQQTIIANAGESAYAEDFWTTTEVDGKTVGDLAKENALNEAIKYTLISQKAKEMGISSDSAEAKEQIRTALSSAQTLVDQFGLSKDAIETVLEKLYLESMLLQKFVDDGEIDISDENLKKTYEENFRTIKHILISYTDPNDGSEIYTPEEASQIIASIKQQLDSGEDFDALMNYNSMDPGLPSAPDGYTFTNNGTMVASFESAAFALEIGAISDIVPSSYGYHILKRENLISYEKFLETNDKSAVSSILELNYEDNLVNELKAKASIERNEKVFGKATLF